tara:strand:- start:837 stop:1247 length:411 start_codon:yes stop_codon:yes gene_type:complete
MEKYFYFRKDSTLANDDDPGNGSVMYPVSKFKGMCVGDSSTAGAVSGSSSSTSLFFDPMKKAFAAEGDAGDDHLDVVVINHGDFKTKDIMMSITEALNEPVARDNGFIVIYDAVTGDSVDSNITAIHVVDQVAAAD